MTKLFLIVMVAILLIQPAEASKGGGGGAFITAPGGSKVLLDLYLKDPTLTFMNSSGPGVKVPTSPSYNSAGLGYFNPDGLIHRKTRTVVQRWAKVSPQMAALLDRALQTVAFFYMKYDIGFQEQSFYLPIRNIATATIRTDRASIQTGALYLNGIGVVFSKPFFDSLNEINQMGSLVHEGLRHVQLGYSYKISDEDLQEITAAIVLEDPRARGSLDFYLNNRGSIEKDPATSARVRSGLHLYCDMQKKYRQLNDFDCEKSNEKPSETQVLNLLSSAAEQLVRASIESKPFEARQKLREDGARLNLEASRLLAFGTAALLNHPNESTIDAADGLLEMRTAGLIAELENPERTEIKRQISNILERLMDHDR